MLESLRSKRNSIVVTVVFAAIILVFIFWGVGPNGDGKDGAVATVDGTAISSRDYAAAHKKMSDYYRKMLKGQFNDEMANKLNLKQAALDGLIDKVLEVKDAAHQGIKVGEADVQNEIKAMPYFLKNGAFDKDLYFRVLSENRLQPAEFERGIQEEILTGKAREKIVGGIKVSDDDIKKTYLEESRGFDLAYAEVDPAAFIAAVKVTDDEGREFLKKNGSDFMVSAKIKVLYAVMSYKEVADGIKLSEAELKEYYEKNKGQFESPAMVKASHILIRPDTNEKDKAKAVKAAKEKAVEVLTRAKAGDNFAALAKKYSMDPGSAKNGGELGWFQKSTMIKPFADAAFALKKGEISGVVESEFGFHVIKGEEIKEPGLRPYSEVADFIKRNLRIEKSQQTARDGIGKIEKAFKEAKDLDGAKAAGKGIAHLRVSSTGFINDGDTKNDIGRDESLSAAAFAVKMGETTKPVETHDGIYLVKVLERVDAHVNDYAAVASVVKSRVASVKAAEAASKKADEVLKRAVAGEEISAIAAKEKLKTGQTGFFSMVRPLMSGIKATANSADLLKLTMQAPIYKSVFHANGKFYVFKLKDVKESDGAGFEVVKEMLGRRVLQKRQQDALDNWHKELRAKAKIKINDKLL